MCENKLLFVNKCKLHFSLREQISFVINVSYFFMCENKLLFVNKSFSRRILLEKLQQKRNLFKQRRK